MIKLQIRTHTNLIDLSDFLEDGMIEFLDVEKRPKRIFFYVGIDLAEDDALFFEFSFPSHAMGFEELHEEELTSLFGFFSCFEEGERRMIIFKERGIHDPREGDGGSGLETREDPDEIRVIEIVRFECILNCP